MYYAPDNEHLYYVCRGDNKPGLRKMLFKRNCTLDDGFRYWYNANETDPYKD